MAADAKTPPPPPGARIRRIEGRGLPLRGDDIDTDRIIPARFLRCVTFDGLGDHVFADDRGSAAGRHPFGRPEFQGTSILIVNANFGCGSSREHAPQSLLRWGIRGLVGESFGEIFFGNCAALGLPCLSLGPAEVRALQDLAEREPRARITLDLEASRVTAGGLKLRARLPPGVRDAFLSGTWDPIALLLERPEEVERVAAELPYVSRWGRS